MPIRSRISRLVVLPAKAEDLDLAGGRLDQPFEDLDGRRLARAVGAEQAEALADGDLQVEAVDRVDGTVAAGILLSEVLDPDRPVAHERAVLRRMNHTSPVDKASMGLRVLYSDEPVRIRTSPEPTPSLPMRFERTRSSRGESSTDTRWRGSDLRRFVCTCRSREAGRPSWMRLWRVGPSR